MYDVIIEEYKDILVEISAMNKVISEAPEGSISKKKINDKDYYYLQKKVNGKVQSKYIKKSEIQSTIDMVERCKLYKEKIEVIKVRKDEIERGAKLLSKELYKEIVYAKISDGMDALSYEEKEKSMGFAKAMNAIEGVAISDELAEDFESWKLGQLMYSEILARILARVEITGGV